MAHIIIDPLSTGANLAHELLCKGEKVIAVWSANVSDSMRLLVAPGLRNDYTSLRCKSEDIEGLEELKQEILAITPTVLNVVAGTESAVHLTDCLSEILKVRSNGSELSSHRRNKYLMGETIRKNQIRSVVQKQCVTLAEGLDFAAKHSGGMLVLKPLLSAGSDDVYKVSADDIKLFTEKFHKILGKTNRLNEVNDCVLVQEFLVGHEFVVDTVSLDGKHRLGGCWKYMKTTTNGADFVYRGMELIDCTSPEVEILFPYIASVLDALNIKHYAAHAEVILDPIKGPCLVEIGARLQGGEGLFMPVSRQCFGHSQVDLLVLAMTSPEKFQELPLGIGTWNKAFGFGVVLDIINYEEGEVEMIDPMTMDEINRIPAFLKIECLPTKGQHIYKTVDCFSTIGSISLWSINKDLVLDAIQRFRRLEKRLVVLKGKGLKKTTIFLQDDSKKSLSEDGAV